MILQRRDNGLGKEEWELVMETVSECSQLREIGDFPWSKEVLTFGVTELNLRRKGLQQESAMVVLLSLLQRSATTVTKLDLR